MVGAPAPTFDGRRVGAPAPTFCRRAANAMVGAPPPTFDGRRVWALPPSIIFRRHANALLVFLIVFLHLSCLARWEIEVYKSLARQFLPMSVLQNSILEEPIVFGFYS